MKIIKKKKKKKKKINLQKSIWTSAYYKFYVYSLTPEPNVFSKSA